MKNEKLKNPNHALHRVVGNCELGFMRARTVILGLVVVLILAVVFYKLASPYQSFLRKDFSYYSELAQACAATLDQHPLGNNPFVWVPVTDSLLPKVIQDLHPTNIKVESNRVCIAIGERRTGFDVVWEQDKQQANAWTLNTYTHTVKYTTYVRSN